MLAILRSTACMPVSPISDWYASSPGEVGMFVADDRTGLIAARASVRLDVCPLTKTMVGFALSLKQFSSAPPATDAVRNLARKERSAARGAGSWRMQGMPKMVVVDRPASAAPTLRNASSSQTYPLPPTTAD